MWGFRPGFVENAIYCIVCRIMHSIHAFLISVGSVLTDVTFSLELIGGHLEFTAMRNFTILLGLASRLDL